jgi:hypothetical protein
MDPFDPFNDGEVTDIDVAATMFGNTRRITGGRREKCDEIADGCAARGKRGVAYDEERIRCKRRVYAQTAFHDRNDHFLYTAADRTEKERSAREAKQERGPKKNRGAKKKGRQEMRRASFGVIGRDDVPDAVILNVLRQTNYDLPLAFQLLRLNRRIHAAMLGERGALGFPRFVAQKLLTCVTSGPFSIAERELNVDRILDVMDADNEFKRALHRAFVAIAQSPTDGLHDALVVRAPMLSRIARTNVPRAAHAALLLELLRPSIVRAIESECVEGRYLYRDLRRAEMQTLVDLIGRSPLRNRYVETQLPDTALKEEIAAYVREASSPFGERGVLLERGPLCFWDTSDVADLSSIFSKTRVSLDLMWPTQNVVAMSFAFAESTFNGKIGHLNVGRVHSMQGVFYANEVFNRPIGEWDVGNVRAMCYMFYGARAFDVPLGAWNVSNVADMHQMFKHAAAFDQPIGSWSVGRVRHMHQMFKGAAKFDRPLQSWDVSNVRIMSQMFKHAVSFNQPLHAWTIGRVTTMHQMFMGARSLDEPPLWDVRHVESRQDMLRDTNAA